MALSAEAEAALKEKRDYFLQVKAMADSADSPQARDAYMQQADRVKQEAMTIQQTGQVFSGRDEARFAAQGATFGWGDEIEAGMRAPFSDQNYGEIHDDLNTDLNATRSAYPTESLTAELMGGAAIPGGALRNLKYLDKLPSLIKSAESASTLPIAARNMVTTGAGFGALAGAGYSESNPLDAPVPFAFDVAKGTATGGLVAPALGLGIPAVYNIGMRVAAKLAQPANLRADQLVGQVMRKTGWDENTVMSRLAELGPEATLADLDNALLGWASVAAEKSDQAANQVGQYATRNEGAKGRLAGAAQEGTEARVGDYQRVQGSTEQGRRTQANDLYGLVENELIPRDTVQDIMETTRGGQAYDTALTNWQDRYRTPGYVPEGQIPLGILDDTQRILQREGERVARGQASGTQDIYTGLSRDVRDRLDDIVPPYRDARESYAAHSGILDAGETGRSMKHSTTSERMDEIEAQLPGMTTAERRQLSRGWLEGFYDSVLRGGGAKGSGYAGSRTGPPELLQRQLDIVEAPGRSGRIMDQLDTEGTYHDTYSFLSPQVNSRTAARTAAREKADQKSGIGGVLSEVFPEDVSAVANIVKNTTGVSEEVATELGTRLMNPGITRDDVRRMIDSGELSWSLLDKIKSAGVLLPVMGAASNTATGYMARD